MELNIIGTVHIIVSSRFHRLLNFVTAMSFKLQCRLNLFIRTNFVRTIRLNLEKEHIKNVLRVGSSNTENYNNNDLYFF